MFCRGLCMMWNLKFIFYAINSPMSAFSVRGFTKKVLCRLYVFHDAIWQSSTVALHKNQHHLWPMASTRPLESRAPCRDEMFFRGGGAFVMLIIWPNLNDPDICCPTCVKPHIQFVPAIHKAGMTLEAVKCLCVYCMCVCVCTCGGGMLFFISASTTAVITSRMLMWASMCSTCF